MRPSGIRSRIRVADLVGQAGGHLGVDEARRHGVHEDVPALHLLRERPGHGVEARLDHGVGDLARVAGVADDARDVDDAAPGAEHEAAQDELGQVPGAAREAGHGVVVVDLHAEDRGVAVVARVVHQHVHPARDLLELLDEGLDLGRVGEVGARHERAGEPVGHGARRRLARVVDDADAHPLRREGLADGAADPGRSARDHRDLGLGRGPLALSLIAPSFRRASAPRARDSRRSRCRGRCRPWPA